MKSRCARPEIFLRFEADLDFWRPWFSEIKVQIKRPTISLGEVSIKPLEKKDTNTINTEQILGWTYLNSIKSIRNRTQNWEPTGFDISPKVMAIFRFSVGFGPKPKLRWLWSLIIVCKHEVLDNFWIPYARHYKLRLVYFLPHFQKPFLCF